MIQENKIYRLVILLFAFPLLATAQVREKQSINSGWQFVLNDKTILPTGETALFQKINLPHTWNALDIVDDTVGYHQGIGWYKKELFISEQYKENHLEFFFEAVFNKKWWAYILLPISWVILFQIYIPTYSFILTSIIFSIFFVKKVNFKFLTIGVFLSFVLLAPTFLFLNSNREYLNRYAEAPNLFTPSEKTFSERLINVTKSFVLIPIGGVFEHQTGYGQNDFVTYYLPMYSYVTPYLGALLICALFWNLYKAIFEKDNKRLILCLWAITPVWSMMVLWVSDILPRYYLHAFPAIMILISILFLDMVKISKFFWLLPIGVITYWVIFNFSYNNFIQNYEYPNGRFRDVAETPYIYFNQAVGWIIKDANQKQCDPVVTNNEENPEFDIWLETKYVWEYIYKRPVGRLRKDLEPCYYVINYKNKVKELGVTNYKVFGLYTVFEYNKVKN